MLRRAIVALALVSALPAFAAEKPTRLAHTGDWEAMAYTEEGGKVCYAAAEAKRVQGGDKGRTATVLLVTHRPKSPGEVSLAAEYGLKKSSEAEIQIGAMKHSFMTQGRAAWAKDAKADPAIVAAMIKGRDVTIRTVPAKGGAITDVVSLSGFSDALAAIDKACGVKR